MSDLRDLRWFWFGLGAFLLAVVIYDLPRRKHASLMGYPVEAGA